VVSPRLADRLREHGHPGGHDGRRTDKEKLARQLGAHYYVDSTAGDPAEALQALGGVDLVLSTVTNAGAMAAVFGGLRANGTLLVVGADMSPIEVPAAAFIAGAKGLRGHASGTSRDYEDTLAFSILQGVNPMIETLPLEKAAKAYEKMMTGEARFRMVLTTA
jgi:D-arabinose 1-dehydrogenase-like Zn-dependent alcohol dehydrogenase